MKRSSYILLLLTFTTAAFLAGSWRSQHAAAGNPSAAGRRILYYTDPMHPSYKSDRPGIAPDCGMQLEPVYADGGPSGGSRDGGMSPEHQGTVKIDAGRQQFSGVVTSAVEKESGEYPIRLFGRVTADEARTYKLNAGADGYIEQVAAVTTGSRVKRDQLLATFSTPMAVMAMQTYLLNLGSEDEIITAGPGSAQAQQNPAVKANIQQRVEQLQNLGMTKFQLAEIRRTREYPTGIKIVSPADGVVLSRNVSPGQKFERGAEWYRIADLSKVWVMVDVFDEDNQYFRPGTRARVSLPGHKKNFSAVVGEVLPQFDANSRTLKVRLEIDNPDYALRPDMFVDAELLVKYSDVISVPLDAVLDSGMRKTVYVDRGEGNFEPREVETGRRLAGRLEIVRGLKPGERIASAGTFMLDSETRMKQSATAVPDVTTKDPVCGMSLQAAKAGARTEYQGVTRYFCSQACKEKFVNNPHGYPVNESVAPAGKATD